MVIVIVVVLHWCVRSDDTDYEGSIDNDDDISSDDDLETRKLDSDVSHSRCCTYTISKRTSHFVIVHIFAKQFLKFFTGTFAGQLAIKRLLDIPLHHNCVATLPCEIYMQEKLKKTNNNIDKKHVGK